MKKITIPILLMLVIAAAWADDHGQTNQVSRSIPSTNSTTRVIGTLKRQAEIVTIFVTTNGTRYTVTDRSTGKTLAEEIPEPELAIQFPDLQRDLLRGIAEFDARF